MKVPTVCLRAVTTRIGSGITPRGGSAVYKKSGRPFVRSQNIGWGELRLRDLAYIDDATHRTFSSTEICAGDILLNITGASIGRSAVATAELAGGNVNQHVCEIRFEPGVMDPHFVNAVLSSQIGQKQINSFQAGGNREGLNFQHVGSIQIPALEFRQQQAIGIAGKDADQVVSTLERVIVKKQAIKQGMMQQLLIGKVRLRGFGGTWTKTEVGDLLEFKNGLNKGSEYFGEGTPIVNFMDVMNAPIITAEDVDGRVTLTKDEIRRFSARRGDMFFTRTSETVGEVGTAATLVDDICDAAFSGFILRGRSRTTELDPRFMAHLFQLDVVRQQIMSSATYTTRALTNGRALSRILVRLPDVREQRAIADLVADVDREIAVLRRRHKKARALKQGMMQELLTGRTRLPAQGTAA